MLKLCLLERRMLKRGIVAGLAFAGMLCAASLGMAQSHAQQQSSGQASPIPASQPSQQSGSAAQSSEDSQQPTETLKVNVNVVQLFFNVKDKHGMLIPNLTKNDFDIAEDGKAQTIKYFTAESNLPLTIGMLIDSSGSQRNVIEMEKEVGGAFLRQTLTDKDEAF